MIKSNQYVTCCLKFLNKTFNGQFGGWFSIWEFSNKLFTNEFVRSTFVVCFHNKYTLILQKKLVMHCKHKAHYIDYIDCSRCDWLYVRGDCIRRAGFALFGFSTRFFIFAAYRLFGLHHSWITLHMYIQLHLKLQIISSCDVIFTSTGCIVGMYLH